MPPADSQAIADAVERLIDDGELRRRLINAGYERARESTFEYAGVKFLNSLRRAAESSGNPR